MSTTTSSTTASSTCISASLYELPIKDSACGIPNTNSYKSTFESCAAPAKVRTYHDDCALYAPALDQSVQDLIDCLYDGDVKYEDVWCSGDNNSTATGSAYPTATATPSKGSDEEEEDAEETGSASGSSNGGADGDDDDTNGAMGAARGSGVIVWAVVGMLVGGMVIGL
ncbi:uncharacterized protein BDV14DRAFT_177128 [Aspergillus stella-maris]|uniref:uncharacterized protein n=1 Tax=Aspergillus stella-maris TaxID=1810926 RepID=UPI003CCD3276